MKIYRVGGAVRDALLGYPSHEIDYVVVGSTAEEMLARGFLPVGKSFPVFLEPQTKEEYALARCEKKTAKGYHGFEFYADPSVTLEEDLKRRDLTINAMAMDENNHVIDPYGGQQDLAKKCLRHVSEAFVEDPVRILRLARFAARFHHLGFTIAAETNQLMKAMVANGEVDALVPERVWKETTRALQERSPEIFFEVLHECNALKILFPELDALYQNPQNSAQSFTALRASTQLSSQAEIRFAALCHLLSPQSIKSLSDRYIVSTELRNLSLLIAQYAKAAANAPSLAAAEWLELFQALDAFRRPQRFADFLTVLQAIALSPETVSILQKTHHAASKIDISAITSHGLAGLEIKAAIEAERVKAIAKCLKSRYNER